MLGTGHSDSLEFSQTGVERHPLTVAGPVPRPNTRLRYGTNPYSVAHNEQALWDTNIRDDLHYMEDSVCALHQIPQHTGTRQPGVHP